MRNQEVPADAGTTPFVTRSFARRVGVLAVAIALTTVTLNAVTLEDLMNDAKLTPKRFASHFGSFDFEAHQEVQLAEVFLRNRRGDCDDYAVLAHHVLRTKGYTPRLIHIRIVGRIAHAVCYITENKAYLDYNYRIYYSTLERSGRTLREIADKVAESLEANWTSVSEFTYEYEEDRKHFVATVVRTDPPENDPDRKSPPPAPAKLNPPRP